MTVAVAAAGSATVSRRPLVTARMKPLTASGFSAANFGLTISTLP